MFSTFKSVLKNAPSLSTLNVSMCQKISNKAFLLDEDSQSEREVSPNVSTCIQSWKLENCSHIFCQLLDGAHIDNLLLTF